MYFSIVRFVVLRIRGFDWLIYNLQSFQSLLASYAMVALAAIWLKICLDQA